MAVRRVLPFALLLLPLTARAVDPGKVKEALLKLPTMSFSWSFQYKASSGFYPSTETADRAAEADKLAAELAAAPPDPARYGTLGDLYNRADRTDDARAAWRKAAELDHAAGADQSQDPAVLARYATALGRSDQDEQGLAVARLAVAAGPGDWRTWHALAELLVSPVYKRLPAFAGADDATRQTVAAEAEAVRAEAVAAVEKERALAPRRAEPLIDRIGLRVLAELIRAAADHREVDPVRLLLHPESLEDMWTAAELQPNDRTRLMSAVWLQLMRGMLDHQADVEPTETALLPLLTPAARDKVNWAREELEDLGREADPRAAAQALASLGLLTMLGDADLEQAMALLRRAAERDPELASPQLLSCGMMLMQKRYDGVLALADAQRQTTRGAFWHLVAAKAALELQQLDAAAERFDAAVAAEPADLRGRLGQLALLLHRAAKPDALERAKAALGDLHERAGAQPNAELGADLLACDIAVELLDGRVADARRRLGELAAARPDHRALGLLREAAGL